MNKIYFAENGKQESTGGTYIATVNLEEAKKLARQSDIIKDCVTKFTDLKVSLMRYSDNKPMFTEYEGELNMEQIAELGLIWWTCRNCGERKFAILNDDECKCLNCSTIQEIPYL